MLGTAAIAPLEGALAGWNIDQARSVRSWDALDGGVHRPGSQRLVVWWAREFPVQDAEVFVVAGCRRLDPVGQSIGRHRVTLRNLEISGDVAQLLLPDRAIAMRRGVQVRPMVWNITDEVRSRFENDSALIAHATIAVNRSVGAGDTVVCEFSVEEFDGFVGASAGRRLEALRRAASAATPR